MTSVLRSAANSSADEGQSKPTSLLVVNNSWLSRVPLCTSVQILVSASNMTAFGFLLFALWPWRDQTRSCDSLRKVYNKQQFLAAVWSMSPKICVLTLHSQVCVFCATCSHIESGKWCTLVHSCTLLISKLKLSWKMLKLAIFRQPSDKVRLWNFYGDSFLFTLYILLDINALHYSTKHRYSVIGHRWRYWCENWTNTCAWLPSWLVAFRKVMKL